MDTMALINLCLQVLKDFRVITATILTIVFIGIGNYVVNYRKKTLVRKRKNIVTPPPTEQPQPATEEKK